MIASARASIRWQSWRARQHRAQDGLLGGVDALAFGTLVFITGTLLVLNAWSVVDTRMAVSAAAREAVRTITEAPGSRLSHEPADDGEGGTQLDQLARSARANADQAMVQHGKTVGPGDLVVGFDPMTGDLRCAAVSVHVTYRAPVIALPFLGIFRDGIEVTVHHSERVDPFRAGIAGEVDCD